MTGLLTRTMLCLEDDAQEEGCQEGDSVLPDGLRCLRNWYVSRLAFTSTLHVVIVPSRARLCELEAYRNKLGRNTFVNTLCGKDVLKHKESDDPSDATPEEGVKIKPVTVGMFSCAP